MKPIGRYALQSRCYFPKRINEDIKTFWHNVFVCIILECRIFVGYVTIGRQPDDDTLYNVVDTSLIPALLYTFSDEGCDEIESIVEALSFIEGTYGLWIHNKLSCNTYIARCGSTLYSNLLTNDFSSVETKGMQSLTEGALYLLTAEGVTEVGGFDTNSPFLII